MARRAGFRAVFLVLALAVSVGAGVAVLSYVRQPLRWLAESEAALRKGMHAQAEILAAKAMPRLADKDRAAWVAAQAAFSQRRFSPALQYLKLIEHPNTRQRVQIALMQSDCQFVQAHAFESERLCRGALDLAPGDLRAHNRLAEIMRIEGRSYEALPHVAAVIRSGTASELVLLAALSTETVYQGPDDALAAKKFLDANPDDPLPLLAKARSLIAGQAYEPARALLLQIVGAYPQQWEAQAALGSVYLSTGDDQAFQSWLAEVNATPASHPGLWLNRGIWEQSQGRGPAAARCFWEALRLEPNLLTASYLLAQQLSAMGRPQDAKPLADRADSLEVVLELTNATEPTVSHIQRLISALVALGRRPEAEAWRRLAIQKKLGLAGFDESITFGDGSGLVDPGDLPTAQLDLADLPLPAGVPEIAEPVLPGGFAGEIILEDRAAAAGVAFQHYNGADPDGRTAYMFEISGGAAAVLDYDADGWPDLYLTQGAAWPLDPQSTQYRDRLFRNQGDGTFRDVTELSGLGDPGLSQAAAVGDVDNDGFPDLFVGNVGANTFFRNQGDGAFVEQPLPPAMAGQEWTSACGWADLNGDGWTDLYIVNYLGGPDVFTRRCVDRGRPAMCHPSLFPGEQDRCFLSQGDGSFRDATDMIQADRGKGLGLMIADLDASGDLDVFVANDGVPNFAFRNHLAETGSFQFTEDAVLMGLAMDERGREQACMGVAMDDVDSDGLPDLFVTNFYREANTLYRQASPGAYIDATRAFHLREGSFYTMGWGTQFFDAELDGDPDLLIANGHLNDFSADGIPYKMRTQFYRAEAGAYQEVSAESLGSYFQREQLGRGLARADWDNDGLEDFCLTRIDAPVSLLFNRSPRQGAYLAFRLSGVASSRDAIGARVRVRAGQYHHTRQLTSGDGFAACNQRQLVFGLGQAESIDEVEISWPSGRKQTLTQLPVNSRWLVIEGVETPERLPQ